MTPFAAILRDAVLTTPGAIGGAFAASDGEMVDSYATIDPTEWAIMTAHYGVILAQLHAAFGVWHFGAVEYFLVEHDTHDVLVHIVDSGYYAMVVLQKPGALWQGMGRLRAGVALLRKEMQ